MPHALIRLLKVAIKAGPAIFATIRALEPIVREIAARNPRIYHMLQERISSFPLRPTSHATEGEVKNKRIERCKALRQHVTYLYASANNPERAKKAVRWRNELESIERAIPLLESMNIRERHVHAKLIDKKLNTLSTQILSETLIDDVEDAVIVEEESAQQEVNAPEGNVSETNNGENSEHKKDDEQF